MVTLDIQIQRGQIGIRQTAPQVHMDIKAPNMELRQNQADYTLDITFPQIVDVDWKEFFQGIGLIDPFEAARREAQEGQATVLEGIDRRVRQGEEISHLGDKSITIAKVFSQVPENEKQVVVDAVPKTPPKITFQMGEIRENYRSGDIKTYLEPGNLGYSFQYGTIDVYMDREPYINITAKGNIFDFNA